MVGRALIGVVIGGFWSMSAATAMRLVPRDPVPRALAMLNGGNALATVVAAPLGSYLGAHHRLARRLLLPGAARADRARLAVVQPAVDAAARAPPAPATSSRLLQAPRSPLGMLAVGVFFMGQFALFTYLRPFLETVTRVNVSTLSLILLALGVAGFVGTTVIGCFLRRSACTRP